jgi:hypothetical protein
MSTLLSVRYKLKIYVPCQYILIVYEHQIFGYVPFKNTKWEKRHFYVRITCRNGRQSFEYLHGHKVVIEVIRFWLFPYSNITCCCVKMSVLKDA